MKNALQIDTENIVRIEEIQCSTGLLPSDTSMTPTQVNKAIIIDCDYRRSLALGSLDKDDFPLTYARALIQRGHLNEAKEFLAQLVSRSDVSARDLSLLKFEQTRISFFESDWSGTIETGGDACKLRPPSVTQLALSQLLANAHFELGNFKEANRELERVEDLSVLYPYAASTLYAQMLRVRLLAREVGPDTAQNRLDQILKERISSQRLDNDLVFSYLRAQMDIKRVRGWSALAEAVGCYVLSVAAGDKLYAALALLDIDCEFGTTPMAEVKRRLVPVQEEFVRVGLILNEIENVRTPTTTGLTLRNHRALSFVNSTHPLLKDGRLASILDDTQGAILISLSLRKMLVQPAPFKVLSFVKEKQVPLVLEFLALGGGNKEQFFRAIWGTQKYVPHLHDNHIATLLHRARKTYEIPVNITGGQVQCDKPIVEIL